jgi:hypothetical protein
MKATRDEIQRLERDPDIRRVVGTKGDIDKLRRPVGLDYESLDRIRRANREEEMKKKRPKRPGY